MKLQIDTGKKTIKIEESVKFDTLIKTLKQLFPNSEWKQFTLETGAVINNWTTPYVVERVKTVPIYPVYPTYPWYCSNSLMKSNITGSSLLKSGEYNVEYKA